MDKPNQERQQARSPNRIDGRLLLEQPPYYLGQADRPSCEKQDLRGRMRRQNQQSPPQINLEAALRLSEQRCREQRIELKAYCKYIDDLENKLVQLSRQNDLMRDRITSLQRHPIGDSQYAQLLDEVDRWKNKFIAADRNHQQQLDQLKAVLTQEGENKMRELVTRLNQDRSAYEKEIQELRALLLRSSERSAGQQRINTSLNAPQLRQVSPSNIGEAPTKIQTRSRIVSLQEQFQELRSKVKRVEQRNEEILEKIKHKKSFGSDRQQN